MATPSTTPRKQPWYAAGLRFECQPDCGRCCTNHDEYAYVYLEGDDLERMAGQLGLAPDEFRRLYTDEDEGRPILRMDDPACPFLDGSRCTVYDARPTQCRTFPFWTENLRSRAGWTGLASFCPGIDRGEIQSLAVIRQHLGERRRD